MRADGSFSPGEYDPPRNGTPLEPLPHAGTDTSFAAAESMREQAPLVRERVLTLIRAVGLTGATCDEAEKLLALSHQTCSARFRELVKRDEIVDSGERRKTRSGRKAAVYVVRVPT